MWGALLPLVTGGMGALAGDEAEKQRRNWNNAAAQTNRFAGIRGLNGARQGGDMGMERGGPTALSGGIQGGMAGLQMMMDGAKKGAKALGGFGG